MNILITGCNGFIGQEAVEYFSNTNHTIISTTRKELDVSNSKSVNAFFSTNKIDVVIHTAVKGGRRNSPDIFDNLVQNLMMFNNLARNSHKYQLMFNFGSGAEFDRRKKIEEVKEDDIFDHYPQDYYGLSKNLITREIHRYRNIVNLRLFGCFGRTKHPDRFIKNSFNRLREKKPILIHQNKKMDFVFVEDVFKIIQFLMENPTNILYKDYNICYSLKTTLKELADIIKDLTKLNNDVIIKESNISLPYTGDASRLMELSVGLEGIRVGVKKMIKYLY